MAEISFGHWRAPHCPRHNKDFASQENLERHWALFHETPPPPRSASRDAIVTSRVPSSEAAGVCHAKITVANMAGLPLDCILLEGHTGPHMDSTTNTRWVP